MPEVLQRVARGQVHVLLARDVAPRGRAVLRLLAEDRAERRATDARDALAPQVLLPVHELVGAHPRDPRLDEVLELDLEALVVALVEVELLRSAALAARELPLRGARHLDHELGALEELVPVVDVLAEDLDLLDPHAKVARVAAGRPALAVHRGLVVDAHVHLVVGDEARDPLHGGRVALHLHLLRREDVATAEGALGLVEDDRTERAVGELALELEVDGDLLVLPAVDHPTPPKERAS